MMGPLLLHLPLLPAAAGSPGKDLPAAALLEQCPVPCRKRRMPSVYRPPVHPPSSSAALAYEGSITWHVPSSRQPHLTGALPSPAPAPAEDCTPTFDAPAVQQAFREAKPEVFAALEQAPAAAPAAPAPACVASGRRDVLEVTFLGTGAAVPSKYRNVTSIFVNLFDRGCLLMDAGQ
jgi:hypothetical protein